MSKPIESYGIGHILFSNLQAAILERGGEVIVKVVQDASNVDGSFVYGIFYKDSDGRFFDVLQQRNAELKTFSRADTLVAAMTRIGVLNDVAIPALTDANLIKPGDLCS